MAGPGGNIRIIDSSSSEEDLEDTQRKDTTDERIKVEEKIKDLPLIQGQDIVTCSNCSQYAPHYCDGCCKSHCLDCAQKHQWILKSNSSRKHSLKDQEDRPSPGEPYRGLFRQGYLPDNEEGRLILRMLKRAFEHRLIFTIGFSRTSSKDGVVTWNDIHHKTRREGGPEKFGYPDPDYSSRVKYEVTAKGISEE